MEFQPDTILRNLPKFSADPLYKDKLKQRIIEVIKPQPHKSWRFAWRLSFIGILLLFVFGGLGQLQKQPVNVSLTPESALNLFQAAPVSAAEIIKRNIERYLMNGTIYHEKTRYVSFDTNGNATGTITYNLWQDTLSDRFYNEVIYPDRQVVQSFDLDSRYSADSAERKVYQEKYIYHDDYNKKTVHGTRVDLAEKFDQLLKQNSLTVEETIREGRSVYVIRDTRDSLDKFWDMLYFDKETFKLLETQKLKDGKLETQVIYETQEALPRTADNLTTLFTFRPQSDYEVELRYFDTQKGYMDKDQTYPSASPALEISPFPIVSGSATPVGSPIP